MRTIHQGLQSVVAALERLIPVVEGAAPEARTGNVTRKATRKLTLSPARQAALKLQGQYIGYMRGLPPRQKAQVKALKLAKGMRQAA
jgi:hypothetical protein